MKKFKNILATLLVGSMVFSLAACGGDKNADSTTPPPANSDNSQEEKKDTPKPSGDVIKIKIGGTVPDDHPITIGQKAFIEKLEELSGGTMTGDLYPNGQLGTGRELVESVQAGDLQMGETTVATSANFTDELSTLQLPFLFPSREVAYGFIETDTAKKLSDIFVEKTGVRIAAWFENGIRQLTNNKKQVVTPDDMKGLKIRVMETPIFIKTFETLGAAATPMAFSEVYTALQQGTVDGQDNPYAITCTNKYYEVQKYMTDLSHCFDFTMFVVNEDFYQSLTDEQRGWFDEAAAYCQDVQHQSSVEKEEGFMKEIDASSCELTHLTDEQRAVFKEKIQPVYDWFNTEYEGKCQVTLADVQKTIAEVEASLA